MAHLQYMPGDPRLVDQLVYELKSKGIFDQFRKECIADVDTRPAYQNLRQRVENSVSTFLARQCWQPDLNKNQLREKLRKHILDGNYLEQGLERIVDQVVNPKVASVFIPQVEDLVYNYLGISRKKTAPAAETSNGKITTDDLLPTDLEAVSPGSVKSTEDKIEDMDTDVIEEPKMEVEEIKDIKEDSVSSNEKPKVEGDIPMPLVSDFTDESNLSIDKKDIPLPTEEIKLENIPAPENSPPKVELEQIELHKIELPKEPNIATEIPTPDEIPLPMERKSSFFKPINLQSEDDSSSDSSLRRNMSPLTPIRNFNNENSCDAQQAFDNDSDSKSNDKKEPSTFRFAIDNKSTENSLEGKTENKDDQVNLSYQFSNQVNINTFNTPMFDDSSNSNNLQIDYESDANSKTIEKLLETDPNSEDCKKDKKSEEKKSSHKSSNRSRDSHRHSSSKDKRSDSKHSNSRDSSRHEKKSKEEHSSSKSKSNHREREKSKDRSDRKDSRDSSRHKTSHKSSSHKDSKSHRSSSSSTPRNSSKHDDKKSSSSSNKDKNDKSSDKSSKEKDKDRKDSKSSSHRSEKDRKSSSSSTSKSKQDDKDKKKEKKEIDDHYGLSGRGNPNRRSTDRDSNDGSSSSKGFHNQPSSKASDTKKDSKGSSSKSDNTSPSGESTSPSDKEHVINNAKDTKTITQQKPIRVENHLEVPIASPPRFPFVPDVTLKKPKFAANFKEAKKMMRMRKFLDEEQKRMNQEAALLLEFQANVRPSLSQVYSSIPGPELEFACGSSEINTHIPTQVYEQNTIIDPAVNPDLDSVQETSKILDVSQEHNIESKNEENKVAVDSKTDVITNEANDETPELAPESVNVDRNKTYSENKPFAQLVDEITEYSKASERNKHGDTIADSLQSENKPENLNDSENRSEFFEITVITEELSESEDPETIQDEPKAIQKPTENVQEITENITDVVPENIIESVTTKSEDIIDVSQENIIDSVNTKLEDITDVSQENIIDSVNTKLEDITDVSQENIIDSVNTKSEDITDVSQENIIDRVNTKSEDITDVSQENIVENMNTDAEDIEDAIPSFCLDQSGKDINIISEKTKPEPISSDKTSVSNAEKTTKNSESTVLNPVTKPQPEELHYFTEVEKYDAEIKKHQYNNFFKAYLEKNMLSDKIYLFNCDTYEESILKEASETLGQYEIVNYFRNGRLKLPKIAKNVVKNVNLGSEITLPVDTTFVKSPSPDNCPTPSKSSLPNKSPSTIFSPVKSECSFELSSDYDAKLEEMVNKTSRQQVMEIILGSVIEESDSPRIDYCMESSIDSGGNNLKRKLEMESTINNNRQVLVPKIRRLSESDQISSTTEESERTTNNKVVNCTPNNTRSKYLGRAKRVGLPRPKRTNLSNSPSSDKSVENYSQNCPRPPRGARPPAPAHPAPPALPAPPHNGKLHNTRLVQRYDKSDLYKPKLHYLCRRNNIS